jgi:hypothetical protein
VLDEISSQPFKYLSDEPGVAKLRSGWLGDGVIDAWPEVIYKE